MSTEVKVILTGDDSPLRKALGSARENLNKFGTEALQPFAKLRDAMGNLGNIMVGLGAVRLTQVADQAAMIQARLKDVSGSFAAAQAAQQQLYASAQRLQVSYAEMAGSFAKMLPAVQQMGGGAVEAQRLAEILMITARLAGASTQEAASSAQQFGQALQSGALQGEELKAILENNGTLARALAQGLGVTVGELRKLGSEGKLTADKVAGALLGQYDQIQARSAELPATVGGAWQQVTNAFERFVGAANEGTGVFAGLSAVLSGLARLIDAVRTTFSMAGTEADRLAKNRGVQEWGEAVGATFAYVIDLAMAAALALALPWENLVAVVRASKALMTGEAQEAGRIWDAWVAHMYDSWGRITNMVSGGEGSTLRNYALNSGQDAPSVEPTGKLKSTVGAASGKKKGDGSLMGTLEAALAEQVALLTQHKQLLDGAKEYELKYWQEVLNSARLSEQDRVAIKKKVAQLQLDVERERAREEAAIEKDNVESWKEIQLLKLEGSRIAAKAMLDQDQITKAQFIDRELAFEEQRFQIQMEYYRRKMALLTPGDAAGQAKIGNDMNAETERTKNTRTQLGADKAQASQGMFGIDFGGMAEGMSQTFSQAFGSVLKQAQTWQGAMLNIYKGLRDSFIKSVVMEPMQAQLAAWGKQLAMKLGFLAQEQGANKLASAATIGTKTAEAAAVTSANAVEAGTGAAASQAMIPIIGPGLALAAMATIFASVIAMGGKMKSAANGYDIPSGVNPVTQLHEEEMVLPKDIANPLRQMLGGGGAAAGGDQYHYNDYSGQLDEAAIRRNARVFADEMQRLHRNGWRPR